MAIQNNFSVAGAGVAELPVPRWTRPLKIGIYAGLFGMIITGAFYLNGWQWVMDGLSTEFAAMTALTTTVAAGATFALIRSRLLNRLLNIRKSDKGTFVFGGFTSPWPPLSAASMLAGLLSLNLLFALESARNCPLPDALAKTSRESPPPQTNEGLMPIYLWDYATWINPAWLEQLEIVIPYEKGPPQKLLPKVYLADPKTHSIQLELHGKRPRSYSKPDIDAIFGSTLVHPRDWPLLWRLEREAGLTADGINVPTLSLFQVGTTQAIGVPWETADFPPGAATRADASGRFFFWGPDGSVFQARCPRPCRPQPARLLELVQFPPDPRGSFKQRLEWTQLTLRKLLEERVTPEQRLRHENLLTLYLVSILTLDPRDPEAFFHLGKLAHNRETALSALRYGRDLGLEQPKILELEAAADRLSF